MTTQTRALLGSELTTIRDRLRELSIWAGEREAETTNEDEVNEYSDMAEYLASAANSIGYVLEEFGNRAGVRVAANTANIELPPASGDVRL